jgi:sulfur carrier protein ThiS
MAEHARPHLHTHNRDRRHSAVAAAAYRLGLKLFDERTETWHDYTKRSSKQVVYGETIGPQGAPAWLLEPGTLWNEVEKAENRVDAQICRDYRIPIPLGVDEKAAVAMARSMAGYIVARFNVPVCIAVHRDNTLDLDGNAKPADKVGFHAHLLFPTRELVREGQGGSETWRFGRKLTELSNRRQSAPIVDSMNEKWSKLANAHLTAAGLPATYESKSYKRLGLDKTPKPTRARRFGQKNQWYPKHPGTAPALDLGTGAIRQRLHARREKSVATALNGNVVRARRAATRTIRGKAPLVNRVSLVGGRTVRIDSHLRLAELMRSAGPRPTNDAEHAALERAMFLADFIESLLFAQERARQAQGDFDMQMMRERAALADARVQKERVDAALRKAEKALESWLTRHPLRARLHVPSDELSILQTNRDAAATEATRVHNKIRGHVEAMGNLSARRDIEAAREERAKASIIAEMQAYKTDFRSVVATLAVALSDVQKNDVAELADVLQLDIQDVMSAARAEAPFVSPRKTNP